MRCNEHDPVQYVHCVVAFTPAASTASSVPQRPGLEPKKPTCAGGFARLWGDRRLLLLEMLEKVSGLAAREGGGGAAVLGLGRVVAVEGDKGDGVAGAAAGVDGLDVGAAAAGGLGGGLAGVAVVADELVTHLAAEGDGQDLLGDAEARRVPVRRVDAEVRLDRRQHRVQECHVSAPRVRPSVVRPVRCQVEGRGVAVQRRQPCPSASASCRSRPNEPRGWGCKMPPQGWRWCGREPCLCCSRESSAMPGSRQVSFRVQSYCYSNG